MIRVTVYISLGDRGYKRISVNGIRKLEHVYLAEKALGKPLPSKAVVHHHKPFGLVICPDQSYHMLIEARTRALYPKTRETRGLKELLELLK